MSIPTPRSSVLMLCATLLLACCPRAPPEEPVRSVKLLTVGQIGSEFSPVFAGKCGPVLSRGLGFRGGGQAGAAVG